MVVTRHGSLNLAALRAEVCTVPIRLDIAALRESLTKKNNREELRVAVPRNHEIFVDPHVFTS